MNVSECLRALLATLPDEVPAPLPAPTCACHLDWATTTCPIHGPERGEEDEP